MKNLKQSGRLLRHLSLLGFTALALNACAPIAGSALSNTAESGITDVFDAATGSLEDLNLKQKEIPAKLADLAKDPYAPPKKVSCKAIRQELADLEVLIGPDVQPKGIEVASNEGFSLSDVENIDIPPVEKLAHDAVMSAVKSHTSFLPFRGIIRRVTGANRHEEALNDAYQAGKLHRAYLKGLAQSRFGRGCLKAPLPKPTISAEAKPAES